MTDDTLLLRQIHPAFIQNERVTSQAFTPTPKDARKLSVYDGDQFTAEESWRHFTHRALNSAGVLAVSVLECVELQLQVAPTPEVFEGHVDIDFIGITEKSVKAAAKHLRMRASKRGWLYRA
ncbi:MAG: hypothetical protein ACLQIB_03000 [Isosphaeraceae bacterium]